MGRDKAYQQGSFEVSRSGFQRFKDPKAQDFKLGKEVRV
jgi:hypothetical protein